ncbi:MAG: hypothetical protein EX285_00305 [Thaumarchaeota archaeon]|nr:hypothetical protein [Nitrososphaerota archaeon]
MKYHEATLMGQQRARKSQHKLFAYSGFAFLTKTVKQVNGRFEPVGEKELVAIEDVDDDNMLVIICDEDGYAKAQTKPLSNEEAKKICEKMIIEGFKEFRGMVKAIK